ncbi:hypothetical protein [Aureimonas glaciei]|uniref:Uncharacterized protein n=1 Tax=Aureimonas glaciei TaxID=1776957 RepID=A0A916Y305_9HYPH|nr:hypothetical protein [Aureimonas glaciei]GGD28612.1 hypothetical protein GCM10011335_34760 [Aureimonas glaciei]
MLDRVSGKQANLERRQEDDRTRLEAERVRHELKVDTERIRWERVMQDQLSALRTEVRNQDQQLEYLRTISGYMRHIAALEGLIRAAGIQIPALVIPTPPPQIGPAS